MFYVYNEINYNYSIPVILLLFFKIIILLISQMYCYRILHYLYNETKL